MKFFGYEVEPEYILEDKDVLKWHASGLGEYIIGKKGGVRWFIKRNNEYRFPTEKDEPDKEIRDYYLIPAKKYEADRAALKTLMVDKGKLSASKDHIVPEVEHFISEGRIVLVSQFVENLARGADFTGMSADDFIIFCKETALLLAKLHDCGVVHGDLKVGNADNVMDGNIVATIEKGKLTPYLIDFDLSFPAPPAKNPESIPYSDGYASPEIVPYIEGEDEHPEVNTATDIFSLGVVYHKLWTGFFPTGEIEKVSAGECIAKDKQVTIDKKFDVRIGSNCGATFISLINWMFAKDPSARPNARQVYDVLDDKIPVPEEFHKGADVKLFADLWDSHKLIAERLPVEDLRALGVQTFRRVNDGGLKYSVGKDGKKEDCLTLDECVKNGYVLRRPADVTEPWTEHNIYMISAEEVSAKGYVEISRTSTGGHRYKIVTASGVTFTHGYEWLISEGLASRKPVAPLEGDKPWPGDGRYADDEYLSSRGVKKIVRVKYGAEKRYRVEFVDRDPLDNVNANTMRKLRYLV